MILESPGGQAFAAAVASAGDVNGDGYADVIVGAPTQSGDAAAMVYIYLGGTGGLSPTPASALTDPLRVPLDEFGSCVAAAGDVNGDGYGDVLVGAPANETNGTNPTVYLYLGGPTGIPATPSLALANPIADSADGFGYSVAGAGDVNGDGYADVVVGADNASSAFLYLGSATGLAATPTLTLTDSLDEPYNLFGFSVAGVGDVNGDGFSDFAVAAGGAPSYSMTFYLYAGSLAGLSPVPLAVLTDSAVVSGLITPWMISAAGDLDQDGYADVVISAISSGANGDEGAAFVYLGGASIWSPVPDIGLVDPKGSEADYFGMCLSGASE